MLSKVFSLRRPFTLLIHLALAVILAGAIVTHFWGIQGTVTLEVNGAPTNVFDQSSGPGKGHFPFSIVLQDIDIIYYPATTTPMDFCSVLSVNGRRVEIAMNKVGCIDGWRFYQSGMGPQSSTLSISHDPWGIAISYTGYILLGIGMVGFFFQRNTPWRALLHKARMTAAVAAVLLAAINASAAPRTMQRPLAANLGKIYVYWNDRVCPLQTMACDVATALYGSRTYGGYTAEQILAGWMFYYDEWLRDYRASHPELGNIPSQPKSKKEKRAAERMALIQWLGTGEAFRVYPYRSAAGHTQWLSLTGRRPSQMSLPQWTFMQNTVPAIKANIYHGRNIQANQIITDLIAGQKLYAGPDLLPSDARMCAERIYNVWAKPGFAAVLAVLTALLCWSYGNGTRIRRLVSALSIFLLCYLAGIFAIIWWLSGHIPVSNGPETMLFMALVALAAACGARNARIKGALILVAGMTLAVAAMGASTPRIGSLMPVLSSPLLSIHVMLVMTAYVLFLLMSVLAAAGLMSKSPQRQQNLCTSNRLLLTPAVCLLAAGIFVGAVWANTSWGRYWGWDPKETCALVMLLVYALPAHWGTPALKCFRRPRTLHIYLLLAVLSVLFTYFGANYLLPGLHSYA